MQDSLTPKERSAAQEVNALGLPVHIQLEDQLIPLPQTYMAAGAEAGDVKPEPAEASLWRTDTDGDLARWLTSGFTPRAAGQWAFHKQPSSIAAKHA